MHVTKVTLGRTASLATFLAPPLPAKMGANVHPSASTTINAHVQPDLLATIARRISTIAMVTFASTEDSARMASTPTLANVLPSGLANTAPWMWTNVASPTLASTMELARTLRVDTSVSVSMDSWEGTVRPTRMTAWRETVSTEELAMIELEDFTANVHLAKLDFCVTWKMRAPVIRATRVLGVTPIL